MFFRYPLTSLETYPVKKKGGRGPHYSIQGLNNYCRGRMCFAVVSIITHLCAISGFNLQLIATVAECKSERGYSGVEGAQC